MSDNNENWKKYKHDTNDVVENFCGACVAIPLAFAGVGVGTYGFNSRKKYKQGKKIAFWGFFISFISLLVALYFYFSCNNCR